jgi:hypothetical protein
VYHNTDLKIAKIWRAEEFKKFSGIARRVKAEQIPKKPDAPPTAAHRAF